MFNLNSQRFDLTTFRMVSRSFNAIEGKFERFFLTLLTDGENVFNDFSNTINGWSENINGCPNASKDFLNCFNGKQTTIKCFEPLNGKALMYVFPWKVTLFIYYFKFYFVIYGSDCAVFVITYASSLTL